MSNVVPSSRRRSDIEVLRQSTVDLIESAPSEIALMRPAPFQKTEAGGVKRTGQSQQLPARKRYFEGIREPTRFLVNRLRLTPEGEEFRGNYVLVGTYDDDIQKGDYFDLDDIRYTVLYVYPNRDWEVKAEIVTYLSGG